MGTTKRSSVYHSHTATEAYPSRTDISLARGAAGSLCAGVHGRVRQPRRTGRASLIPDTGRVVTEEEIEITE